MPLEIALALGGGGSKGFAHIGVLRALDRGGVRVRAVAGTSVGGVVGSAFAAGYDPDWIESFVGALPRNGLFARSRDDGPSLMGLSGVSAALAEALGDLTFEELAIPFAVTAVDVETAQLLALRHGIVREAVLATIAIPGVFPARTWNGRTLVDGATLDPVPVALARSLAPHLPVVAVALSPPCDQWVRGPRPRLLVSPPFLGKYLARFRWAQAMNLFLSAAEISVASLTDLRLALDRPEAVIRPDVGQIGLIDPVDVADVARIGEHAARESLPAILGLDSLSRSLGRRVRGWVSQGDSGRYAT